MSPSELGDRKTFSDQEKTERLIMPTEFQMQNDLEAIINIANFGISKLVIPPVFYKERHPNFILRTFPEVIVNPTIEIGKEESPSTEVEEKADIFKLIG